jgi:hypothetical protein
MSSSLFEYFASLEDPRIERNNKCTDLGRQCGGT